MKLPTLLSLLFAVAFAHTMVAMDDKPTSSLPRQPAAAGDPLANLILTRAARALAAVNANARPVPQQQEDVLVQYI